MTFADGFRAGIWLLGAVTPLVSVVLLTALATLVLAPAAAHRWRVTRLHREARRSGRNVTPPPYDPARHDHDAWVRS